MAKFDISLDTAPAPDSFYRLTAIRDQNPGFDSLINGGREMFTRSRFVLTTTFAILAASSLTAPPASGQLLIQDGDYYPSLSYNGLSILMTGGRVDRMELQTDQIRIEGGTIGRISTAGGHFVFTGGDFTGSLDCWRFSAGVDFEGYSFRARRYENPIKDTYWYHVEGILADGHFVSMSLAAAADNGAGVGLDFTFVGEFIPGDTDGDLDIDLTDLNVIRNNFGAGTSDRASGDLDGDGEVGLSDLNEVRNNFGNFAPFTLGPEYDVRTNPVPEPASFVLACLSGLGFFSLAGIPSRRRWFPRR